MKNILLSPDPATPSTPSTGDTIAADIKLATPIVSAVASAFGPEVGAGVNFGLRLLAEAEPAVYNSIVAILQGTALTPDQESAKQEAIARLQTPADYFA